MEYKVIYSSKTGNTEKVAQEIFYALPGNSKDIVYLSDNVELNDADTYFIGFHVQNGTCSQDVMQLLLDIEDKNVAIFGTCGSGDINDYYHKIEQRISVFLSDTNHYLGCFICQGKMPSAVRTKYENMLELKTDQKMVSQMLRMFDEGLIHPDRQDLKNAATFSKNTIKQLKEV